MKHLKLFFALFAMLALGVGNAWADEVKWDLTTTSYSSSADAKVIWSSSYVTATAIQGEGTKVTNYLAKSSQTRLYNKNTLSITPISGYSINSIVITATGNSYVIKGTWTNGTSSTNDKIVTITPTDGTKTISCAISATCRLTEIKVLYESTSGGGETPEPDPDPTPDPEPEPDPTPDPGTGGELVGEQTATYVVSTATAVTTSGIVPDGSSASLSGTGSLSSGFIQCSNGKNHTLTLKGYAGYKIKSISIHVKSNSSKGTGSFSVVAGSTTIASIAESAFNTATWNGSWNNSGVDKVLTMTNDSYEIQSGEDVKLTINCKSGSSNYNSLYIKSYTIVYESTSTGGETPEPGTPATELTDAQFAWSAATAEATMGASNTFPTLTNTLPVSVTYESSNTAAATIAADGTITLVAPGTTTISAKFAGDEVSGTTYAPKTVTYALTVLKAPATPTSTVYVKVTSTAGITDGEYLIVYEEGKVAFNGALTDLDAVGNTIEVTINNNTIAGTNYIDAATFTIDVTNGTILSASGKYIGKTANSNGLDVKTTAMTNTFAIDANGNAVITGNTAALRYNKTADQKRFRYYKDGGGTQEKIALYKKASKHTVTIADCTNGTISAKMGETALATNDQVLSGIQITLSNEAAAGYKHAAYDVYKTGDNTKVTVDGNTFIMPEFDVTISATFEQLKELDKIEVNTTNVKTTFWQGETFNSTGLVVTAYYTDETSTIVTPKSITGSTAEAGTKQVTVSYTEGEITKETEYDITVKAIANNEETPYTVTVAREIIDAVGETTVDVYVQGIVSKIVTAYNSEYGNISYNISEDGKTTSAQLQAYRGKSYNGDNFTSADDIQVDDKVVVKGTLKKHETTYEFAQDNQLVSLVRSTEPKPTAATLPFEFDGNKDDIADVVGMSQTGLGTYDSSPKLKFDTENDNVIIHFDSEPGEFSFLLKQNGGNVGIFTVYESENGEDYTSIWSGGDLGGTGKSATIKPTISATSRYVKFEYTTKPSGTNYGLGQISIKKIDKRQEAGLAWNPATVSLTVGDAFTAPTFSNPNSVTGITFTSDNEALATVNNAGAISLVSGKTGTATITATFTGNENYKEAEVKCTISVSPKTENVVILAQHAGKWYALKAEYVVDKTDRLVALPVDYINGTLYNVPEEDKALITWERVVIGNKATFKNGDNYLKGKSSTTLILEDETTGLYQWDYPSYTMVLEGSETVRTFLYNSTNNCFRNYDSANASDGIDVEKAYSALPVVTAPVYGTGTITPIENLTPQMYGTICLENNVVGYEGITFYKVAGKEDNKVIFDEVTELVAGMPYIYIADSKTATIVIGEETAAEAGYHNSLQGTFTQIDQAEDNILVGNYMLVNNIIKKCGINCGLKANRAYFVATELEGLSAPQAQMPGRRRVSLNTTGENAATGIGDVVVPTEQATKVIINGQLIIIRDGEKFNVQGQRL